MLILFEALAVYVVQRNMQHVLTICNLQQSGKTKFTIENATKTRIVLADTRVHILGSFQNIRVAR